MATDLKRISQIDTEPGELPPTMAAWVIRPEREGEPEQAFQIEEVEGPEPGAFEGSVRVMAAGVNVNNGWAALGKRVSALAHADHPQYGHQIWGAAGGLGVFATQLVKAAGAASLGVVSSTEKGELVKRLGAKDFIDRNEFAGMMRRGGESPEEEKARFKVSREFAKRVKELLGDAPDVVFEHVGQATFPTSVLTVKTFGKVVICGATSGYTLDFDVRYLWMRQKEILGSHFANAWECNKANHLIETAQIRPVLWQTMPFEDVARAHQLMHENKHCGKIAILVGA